MDNYRPISALIGGIHVAPGRVMGHAGAFALPGEPDALTKIRHLEQAGVTTVNHPEKLGGVMKTLLEQSGRAGAGSTAMPFLDRRGMHTASKIRPMTVRNLQVFRSTKRTLYIRQDLAFDLLRERGINSSEYSGKGKRRLLAIAVDRQSLSPCIVASPASILEDPHADAKAFPFDYRTGFDTSHVSAIATHLQLGASSTSTLLSLIASLVDLFKSKEAFLLEITFVERLGDLKVVSANFGFDDAAYRSTKRQVDVHATLRRTEDEDAAELEAEKDGIVYIKLFGNGNIGTLVNGAGLAMNTVDALADAGGQAANFLDTGGKATSETVKRSFQVILRDERVRVIFVNIFGGLTRGDMIADGILMAFKELDMRLPVVIRIRGTNEAEGQRIVSWSLSTLPILSCSTAKGAIETVVRCKVKLLIEDRSRRVACRCMLLMTLKRRRRRL